MKQSIYTITENTPLNALIYRMVLQGDTSAITKSGQFINIKLDGYFLRRPISVCNYDEETITIIYKVVGEGTKALSQYKIGEKISFSGTYGYFKGEKFNVKVSVFTPSGKTENTNGSYVFGEAGQYAFTFSSEIQGETVREQISVNVSAGLASFIADKTGFSGGEGRSKI